MEVGGGGGGGGGEDEKEGGSNLIFCVITFQYHELYLVVI